MDTFLKVQEVLTQYGCSIKTRLGLHDSPAGSCSDDALIFLELASEKEQNLNLIKDLETIENIKVKLVEI